MPFHKFQPSLCAKAMIIFSLLVCLSATTATASNAVRKDSISVWGKVLDLFTGDKLTKGIVTVYDEKDSIVVIDSIRPAEKKHWGIYEYNTEPGYGFKLKCGGDYKIRFDVDGYVVEVQELKIPDRQYHKYTTEWMKDYKLRKKPKEHMLGEARVRATLIRMVVKGDTVEYNAPDLAEGAMLDKLLETMPGMEMRENGEIFYNGKKVESLLVNGKDFFKGDPKVALENLPAYTVKKVQVYRKDDEASYLIKDSLKREEMKKLVVNVKLKKEYEKGWIFNTDFAYGTQDRYITRATAIYFTNVWKFLSYVNLNNVNLSGSASDNGDFWGNMAPRGLHRTKEGGFKLMYSKADKLDFQTGLNVSHRNDFDLSKSSSTSYFTSGDTYSRSRSESRNSTTSANYNNWLSIKTKTAWIGFSPINFDYNHQRGSGNTLSATFNDNPLDTYRGASLDSLYAPAYSSRLEALRLNTVLDATQSVSTSRNISSHLDTWLKSPIFGNALNMFYHFTYRTADSRNYQHYLLDNKQASSESRHNIYRLAPSHSISLNTGIRYSVDWKKGGGLELSYNYDYSQNKNNPERYRLDSLPSWNDFDQHPLGDLPSVNDWKLHTLDPTNSYDSRNISQTHTPRVSGRFTLVKNLWLNTGVGLPIKHESISDSRYSHGQAQTASLTSPSPSVALNYYKDNDGVITNANLDYNSSQSMPSIQHKVDLTDNTNPLFISKGNPNLKNRTDHRVSLRAMHMNAKHVQNYSGSVSFTASENETATTTTYNRSTGVTTYMPRNINGNWSLGFNLGLSRSIDKNDRFSIGNRLSYTYNHNVDYTTDAVSDNPDPIRSVVYNNTLQESINIEYRHAQRFVGLTGNINWRKQNSSRTNFERLSAAEFRYGIRSHGPIVWGFEYETDLTVHSRRGYNDPQMNDDHILWGLKLSRAFLKGKPLTLRLEMNDLLGQISQTHTNINAQGRSEVWYQSIPRFALLHVCYRFNTLAKKKQDKTEGDNNEK